MTCSINFFSVGTDHTPQDSFTISDLTAAGIQLGSTCIVAGCYRYVYYYNRPLSIILLTPTDSCYIKGEMDQQLNIS